MNTQAKICPLMSNAEKKVYCTNDCAWLSNELPHKCAVYVIIEAIDYAAEKIRDLNLSIPN